MATKPNKTPEPIVASSPPWAPTPAAPVVTSENDAGAAQSAGEGGNPTPDQISAPTTQPASGAPDLVADELVDTITVTVPRAYKLRIDNHRVLEIPAGVQEMEREHAEHWYSQANGVQVYKRG